MEKRTSVCFLIENVPQMETDQTSLSIEARSCLRKKQPLTLSVLDCIKVSSGFKKRRKRKIYCFLIFLHNNFKNNQYNIILIMNLCTLCKEFPASMTLQDLSVNDNQLDMTVTLSSCTITVSHFCSSGGYSSEAISL